MKFGLKFGSISDRVYTWQAGRSVWVRFGYLFGSGQLWVKSVRIGYGLGSGEVWVRIYFGSIMFGSDMGSVLLKSGSDLFGWCYGNSVRDGYGLGLLWVG